MTSESESLPASADTIVVGGGIVGSSVAYHLAKRGQKDVLLLEQNALAGGTTWHAAGMVGQLRTSSSMTLVNRYSVELYRNLEKETGLPTGWNQVGSLIVARTEARMTQLRRSVDMAEMFDVEAHLIDADAAGEKWPGMRTDDLLGAVWLPSDGKVKPKETALALAEGARQGGVSIREGVRVTGLLERAGHIAGVRTTGGDIHASTVILCGGMWTHQLAKGAGIVVPLQPVEHHYVTSPDLEGMNDNRPCGRDPDAAIYFRSEGNAVLLGAFQHYTKPWNVDRVPDDFSFQLLEDDWQKFAEPLAAGRHRIPALADVKFDSFLNGPESFTPDNNFLLGALPEMDGLYIAAGFNSAGIACAGGAGKYLADWVVDGAPPIDLWSVDPRRFAAVQNNLRFLRERVTEVLGLHYRMAWPNLEMETGRGLRRSPLHEALKARGACFGQKLGIERPNWFAPEGMEPKTEYSFGRQNWFDAVAEECRATRERVALFDQSSFSKYILRGDDVAEVLNPICAADVDVPVGSTVYTAMLNSKGTYESDLTVIRTALDAYYIITASGQLRRDFHWIKKNLPKTAQAEVFNVTSGYGVIGVMGPESRALLQAVSDADLGNEAFPFGTAKRIAVGKAMALAVRITYVGELGWELHLPADQMVTAYDALREAGEELGVCDAGHYAINSMRLEKGYRAWGAELSTDDNPFQAGLTFTLAWDVPFNGREALLPKREEPITRRLLSFMLEDHDAMLWGNESIRLNGNVVGRTTSGAYGFTLGKPVALGYVSHPEGVSKDYLAASKFTIRVDGKDLPATHSLRAPYDPKREKILM
jgi:4-methylaminobutanoate oxidase (formaldehyde-forming)